MPTRLSEFTAINFPHFPIFFRFIHSIFFHFFRFFIVVLFRGAFVVHSLRQLLPVENGAKGSPRAMFRQYLIMYSYFLLNVIPKVDVKLIANNSFNHMLYKFLIF